MNTLTRKEITEMGAKIESVPGGTVAHLGGAVYFHEPNDYQAGAGNHDDYQLFRRQPTPTKPRALKFAVIAGRFDGAAVGATVSRDMAPDNMPGFVPCHRFTSRREADREAMSRADFGSSEFYEVLTLRRSGRRGWIVVDVLEGAQWDD